MKIAYWHWRDPDACWRLKVNNTMQQRSNCECYRKRPMYCSFWKDLNWRTMPYFYCFQHQIARKLPQSPAYLSIIVYAFKKMRWYMTLRLGTGLQRSDILSLLAETTRKCWWMSTQITECPKKSKKWNRLLMFKSVNPLKDSMCRHHEVFITENGDSQVTQNNQGYNNFENTVHPLLGFIS